MGVSVASPNNPLGNGPSSAATSSIVSSSTTTSSSLPSSTSGSSTGTSSVSLDTQLPTATAAPVFSCPDDNGVSYVSPSGQAYYVECGVNQPGYDLNSRLQPNLESCVDSCGTVSGCTGVSWQSATARCYYKSSVGKSEPHSCYQVASSYKQHSPHMHLRTPCLGLRTPRRGVVATTRSKPNAFVFELTR